MLTIGKLGATRGQLEYYDAQVAVGAEDYYAGRGESPGRWQGSGLRALGLAPGRKVERGEFMALMRGRHPRNGAVLRAMGQRSTVSGFDLTWSAPKSLSVLFAIADDDVAGHLLESHESAVAEALSYLEREACWTRRGRDGAGCLAGEGFVAAAYRHRMSRAGDPQLHTHVVVANMTLADGRYTALDARWLYAHKSAAGAVYRAVLRHEARKRLPWAAWHPSGRGLFELDGVPDPVVRHFSQRRAEIEERAAELAGAGAVAGLSRGQMQGIALATRKAKSYDVDGPGWREQARSRAAEHGLGSTAIRRLQERLPVEPSGLDGAALAARLSGAHGLTESHNSFVPRHALAEIACAFPQGAIMSELDETQRRYLDDGSVVPLANDEGEPRYTTRGLLAREREIVDGAARRAALPARALPAPLIDQVLAACTPTLNDDQAAAVRAIASSGNGVEAITALAGTGKTTMVAALAAMYRRAGWQVIGTAPTARAARQLREIAGVEARTIHSQLAQLDRTSGLGPRTLLVIDEAGMAPTRRSADLFVHAERAGAKLVAIGDPGQLASVEAGGWLAAIVRAQAGPALQQVMRQRDVAEQAALGALHDGEPGPYLTQKRDAITVHAQEVDALRRVAGLWHDAQAQHGRRNTVMITRDNLTRERLNRAARALLKADGTLEPGGVMINGREFASGDRVVARRNDRGTDIDNGTTGTVVTVSADGSIVIETDAGEPKALEAGYVAAHLEHAYVVTAHTAQGGTFTWAGVIGRPHEFTREWAYTALSRARDDTVIHLIGEPSERDREREEYAPAEPRLAADEALEKLRQAMKRQETEPLAAERTPARRAHQGPPNLPPISASWPATIPPGRRVAAGQ
jgi:conjugative relaxase-like TrwC/TraI family protein